MEFTKDDNSHFLVTKYYTFLYITLAKVIYY